MTDAMEQALQLWTRRNGGAWSTADEADLQHWLQASPDHQAAYEKVARAWELTGRVAGRLPRATQVTAPPGRPAAARWMTDASRGTTARWITAAGWGTAARLAAGVAVAAIIAAVAFLANSTYTQWHGTPTTWTAARGHTRSFLLADGTRIVLDEGSTLVARIGSHSRRVSLEHGEALVSVQHDASRPFEMQVGSGLITDLGTRFDVENVRGEARVAVLEGRVEVSTQKGTLRLAAGSAGGYAADGALLPISQANESVTLWQEGLRRFNAVPLTDVLDRLARYHAVSFELTEPQLRQLTVSGTFRTADLKLFLRTLQAALPIQAQWTDTTHVQISPRHTTQR